MPDLGVGAQLAEQGDTVDACGHGAVPSIAVSPAERTQRRPREKVGRERQGSPGNEAESLTKQVWHHQELAKDGPPHETRSERHCDSTPYECRRVPVLRDVAMTSGPPCEITASQPRALSS